ncbi:MAG: flagellar brake protein [Fimbriimonadaceae bacterium]
MNDVILLICFLIAAFCISALVAYVLTRPKFATSPPEIGATIRIRATTGMYRAKLLNVEANVWRISCPLSRNHYVPLRPNEAVTIEAPISQGVYLFKTSIQARDEETHELTLAVPSGLHATNRRNEPRIVSDEKVYLDSEPANLADISTFGARVFTNRRCHIGERIQVELRGMRIYGWVLDFAPTRVGETYREAVRVRFEESIVL